jgi:hypothetical protein
METKLARIENYAATAYCGLQSEGTNTHIQGFKYFSQDLYTNRQISSLPSTPPPISFTENTYAVYNLKQNVYKSPLLWNHHELRFTLIILAHPNFFENGTCDPLCDIVLGLVNHTLWFYQLKWGSIQFYHYQIL